MSKVKKKNSEITCLYQKEWVGWLFVMPCILGILIFQAYPIFSSLSFSLFEQTDGVWRLEGFGFGNYSRMFTEKIFWKACGITGLYTIVSVPLNMILSFLLAVMLNQKIRGVGVYRVLIYLPVIIPVTVSGLVYRNMFDYQYGILNHFITGMGLEPAGFFEQANTSLVTYIFLGMWGLGGGMILWLSALKNVPTALYEAADIDGASAFIKLVKVTIPMCSSMIFYNLIVNIIGSLQTFGSVFAITGGSTGVGNSLLFLVVKIYSDAFNPIALTYGLACAECWVLFIVIALLTGVIFKTSKWVFYGEEA